MFLKKIRIRYVGHGSLIITPKPLIQGHKYLLNTIFKTCLKGTNDEGDIMKILKYQDKELYVLQFFKACVWLTNTGFK